MILAEFDPSKTAVINPCDVVDRIDGFPETLICVFSHVLFGQLISFLEGREIAQYRNADGVWPVYEAVYRGRRFAFAKARLGAAACVGSLEDCIALGAKRIILLGNCGVLDRSIGDCGIIMPTGAIRDEGTSFHYAPAADWIEVNRSHRALFRRMLAELGYSCAEGTTWTTDAFYRETPDKVRKRKEMGAVCVEMEGAAVQALCDFRGVDFFQFFYAGDNLDNPQWDPRSLSNHARLDEKQKIALLAVELAYRIETEQECPGAEEK